MKKSSSIYRTLKKYGMGILLTGMLTVDSRREKRETKKTKGTVVVPPGAKYYHFKINGDYECLNCIPKWAVFSVIARSSNSAIKKFKKHMKKQTEILTQKGLFAILYLVCVKARVYGHTDKLVKTLVGIIHQHDDLVGLYPYRWIPWLVLGEEAQQKIVREVETMNDRLLVEWINTNMDNYHATIFMGEIRYRGDINRPFSLPEPLEKALIDPLCDLRIIEYVNRLYVSYVANRYDADDYYGMAAYSHNPYDQFRGTKPTGNVVADNSVYGKYGDSPIAQEADYIKNCMVPYMQCSTLKEADEILTSHYMGAEDGWMDGVIEMVTGHINVLPFITLLGAK